MLNPYVLLGLGIFYLASVAGAYFKGGQIERDHAKAEYSKQLEGEIKQANDNSVIDMQAAYDWGQSNAKIRERVVTIRSEAATVTASSPMAASCDLDNSRFGLLQRAIQAANLDKATADSLSDAVSKSNATSKPER